MKNYFRSNGKLLLTGEYVILDGATGLAIPTRYGQDLSVNPISFEEIIWKSLDSKGKVWFSDVYNLHTLQSKSENPNQTSIMISHILTEARKLNPNFLFGTNGFEITTRLDFPGNWGLGSSSTLINNIAEWAGIDPYQLLDKTFGGSGYDIAAARNDYPILYTKSDINPEVTPVPLQWEFSDHLFFVYLNKKQNSRSGIAQYRKFKPNPDVIDQISRISQQLYRKATLAEFELLLKEHEQIISKTINIPTIQTELFSDYSGVVKSLGAWGGDFVLATGNKEKTAYFTEKGFHVIISFNDMILHKR